MVCWRLLPVRDLSLRRWDDEWVASDAISGDTHLLSLAAGIIVTRLQAGPVTTTDLTAALMGTDQTEGGTVQECLDALAALDLIEPCPA
ncbi:MAG: hypothetical protein M3A44_02985 [Gammaproteobacteria bacterium]